jgi:hypothetical protein
MTTQPILSRIIPLSIAYPWQLQSPIPSIHLPDSILLQRKPSLVELAAIFLITSVVHPEFLGFLEFLQDIEIILIIIAVAFQLISGHGLGEECSEETSLLCYKSDLALKTFGEF